MSQPWDPKPGDKVVRRPREEQMSPVRVTVTTRRAQSRALASPFVLMYSFAALITLGTVLLLMPFANNQPGFTPFLTALFTATSAATVTGLVIEETATYWSRAGQVIIMGLIFISGLGMMTIATCLLILIGQRVSLTQTLLVRESIGVNQMGGLRRLTVRIVLVAVAIQLVGFTFMLVRFSFMFPPAQAVWLAAFHTVSAFNNAGFSAWPVSSAFSFNPDDHMTMGIHAVLIVLGGISYWVMVDIVTARRFSLLTLNTKIVLTMSVALLLLGALVFFVAEYGNPRTMGPLPVPEKVVHAVFQSVSARTAGFNTISFGETEQHTNFFFIGLMFIGAASASAAGGIKVNTLGVLVFAVLSTLRGRAHASAFGREIPHAQVQRAMSIDTIGVGAVFVVALLLTFTQTDLPFIELLFESVSAFGTVGLSTGVTGSLTHWGQLIIVVTMFIGKVGPLTLGLALVRQNEGDLFRYARERVTIG